MDRQEFLQSLDAIADFLFLDPASDTQKIVTGIVAGLVLVVALGKLHKFGKAARGGLVISLLASGVSVFFLLVLAVWGQDAISALDLVPGQQKAGLAILLGLGFFAGVAPWSRFCFKSAYFTSVAAWLLALFFAAGAVYAVSQAWSSGQKALDDAANNLSRTERAGS